MTARPTFTALSRKPSSLTFTYYLRDLNGDQMLQHDDRVVYGFKASKTWFTSLFGASTTNVIGVQARIDDIKDVGIFPTFERQTIGNQQNASVLESNGAVYAESSTQWLPFLQTTLGLREDQFDFDVKDKMRAAAHGCIFNTSQPVLGYLVCPKNVQDREWVGEIRSTREPHICQLLELAEVTTQAAEGIAGNRL